jgi:hypothetical protein
LAANANTTCSPASSEAEADAVVDDGDETREPLQRRPQGATGEHRVAERVKIGWAHDLGHLQAEAGVMAQVGGLGPGQIAALDWESCARLVHQGGVETRLGEDQGCVDIAVIQQTPEWAGGRGERCRHGCGAC